MGKARLAIAAAGFAMSACATMPALGAAPESIRYETGPCFGACPVYTVTVRADGSGLFEGRRFTAVSGSRAFRITPGQYRAFAAWLAPLRPRRGILRYDGAPLCGRMATDLPSADVKWRLRDGSERELYYYYGCDMDGKRAMAERLRKAPGLLPIAAFIRAGP
ncbi:MAG: hypothetical protein QOH81_1561 [Sphingomonadales bacterium]|jgi:hypothetical protein|nr:hypothetical protein [Sphingomonadales bacterium]